VIYEFCKVFNERDKVARDGLWKIVKTVEPKPYPKVQWTTDESGGCSDERSQLSEAVEKVPLEMVSDNAPCTCNKKMMPHRWLVIGRTHDALLTQTRDIERETARSKHNLSKDKPRPQTPKQACDI
jgi:hypothetical protein